MNISDNKISEELEDRIFFIKLLNNSEKLKIEYKKSLIMESIENHQNNYSSMENIKKISIVLDFIIQIKNNHEKIENVDDTLKNVSEFFESNQEIFKSFLRTLDFISKNDRSIPSDIKEFQDSLKNLFFLFEDFQKYFYSTPITMLDHQNIYVDNSFEGFGYNEINFFLKLFLNRYYLENEYIKKLKT